MTRFATLLALGAIPGACSPAQPADNSAATANISASVDGESEPSMSETRIWIASDYGRVTAELVDNDAVRGLVRMLPLTIEMRDHLRQEKTGTLPAPLPELQRQTEFSAGTL